MEYEKNPMNLNLRKLKDNIILDLVPGLTLMEFAYLKP
jgi:hypothetical protein